MCIAHNCHLSKKNRDHYFSKPMKSNLIICLKFNIKMSTSSSSTLSHASDEYDIGVLPTKKTPSVSVWEKMYFELCKFKAEYGHCNVPRSGKDAKLGNWCKNQRHSYNNSSKLPFPEDRFVKLKAVGFSFSIHNKPMAFEEGLLKLKHHYTDHGTYYVVLNNEDSKHLKNFIKNLRASYQKGKLSPEKFSALDAISFFDNDLHKKPKARITKSWNSAASIPTPTINETTTWKVIPVSEISSDNMSNISPMTTYHDFCDLTGETTYPSCDGTSSGHDRDIPKYFCGKNNSISIPSLNNIFDMLSPGQLSRLICPYLSGGEILNLWSCTQKQYLCGLSYKIVFQIAKYAASPERCNVWLQFLEQYVNGGMSTPSPMRLLRLLFFTNCEKCIGPLLPGRIVYPVSLNIGVVLCETCLSGAILPRAHHNRHSQHSSITGSSIFKSTDHYTYNDQHFVLIESYKDRCGEMCGGPGLNEFANQPSMINEVNPSVRSEYIFFSNINQNRKTVPPLWKKSLEWYEQRQYEIVKNMKSEIEQKGSQRIPNCRQNLHYQDITRLLPPNRLKDDLINHFIECLVDTNANESCFCADTMLFEKLTEKATTYSYENVRRWFLPRSGSRYCNFHLFDFGLVLIPVHLPNHWILVAIQPYAKTITIYDSLSDPTSNIIWQVARFVRKFVEDEHKRFFGMSTTFVREIWRFVFPPTIDEGGALVVQQTNGVDCGVCMCLNMFCLYYDIPTRYEPVFPQLFGRVFMWKIMKHRLSTNTPGTDSQHKRQNPNSSAVSKRFGLNLHMENANCSVASAWAMYEEQPEFKAASYEERLRSEERIRNKEEKRKRHFEQITHPIDLTQPKMIEVLENDSPDTKKCKIGWNARVPPVVRYDSSQKVSASKPWERPGDTRLQSYQRFRDNIDDYCIGKYKNARIVPEIVSHPYRHIINRPVTFAKHSPVNVKKEKID